jgi:esterase/lipase superfamily enzyme
VTAEGCRHKIVTVFYGTDRAGSGKSDARVYGTEFGPIEHGVCKVSVPDTHTQGHRESPAWPWEREDPRKHIVLMETRQRAEEDFFAGLKTTVAATRGRSALVFVHGYRMTFESAARRTAQLAYDLDFPGVPAFYSWPTRPSKLGYWQDAKSVQETVPCLRAFLEDIVARGGAEKVFIIAHSMGSRAVSAALAQSFAGRGSNLARSCRAVLLAAPDIGVEEFRTQIAPAMLDHGARVAVYASASDKALHASEIVNGAPRLGDSRRGLLVLDAMETVDATKVNTSFLGHSAYGDNRVVIADMHEFLVKGWPAGRRYQLQPARAVRGAWEFR